MKITNYLLAYIERTGGITTSNIVGKLKNGITEEDIKTLAFPVGKIAPKTFIYTKIKDLFVFTLLNNTSAIVVWLDSQEMDIAQKELLTPLKIMLSLQNVSNYGSDINIQSTELISTPELKTFSSLDVFFYYFLTKSTILIIGTHDEVINILSQLCNLFPKCIDSCFITQSMSFNENVSMIGISDEDTLKSLDYVKNKINCIIDIASGKIIGNQSSHYTTILAKTITAENDCVKANELITKLFNIVSETKDMDLSVDVLKKYSEKTYQLSLDKSDLDLIINMQGRGRIRRSDILIPDG